jgi:hypothetical protein
MLTAVSGKGCEARYLTMPLSFYDIPQTVESQLAATAAVVASASSYRWGERERERCPWFSL